MPTRIKYMYTSLSSTNASKRGTIQAEHQWKPKMDFRNPLVIVALYFMGFRMTKHRSKLIVAKVKIETAQDKFPIKRAAYSALT